jgi:hypothetical protein
MTCLGDEATLCWGCKKVVSLETPEIIICPDCLVGRCASCKCASIYHYESGSSEQGASFIHALNLATDGTSYSRLST